MELTRPYTPEKGFKFSQAGKYFSTLSPRTLALLRLLTRSFEGIRIYEMWLRNRELSDNRSLYVFQEDAIQQILLRAEVPERHLEVLSAGYKAGVLSQPYASHRYVRGELLRDAPVKLAMEIVERADEFPSFLVAAAEGRCKSETAKTIRPVGKVAGDEGWFKQH